MDALGTIPSGDNGMEKQGRSVPSTSHRVVWLEGVPLDGTALTLRRGQGVEDWAVKLRLRNRTDVKM
uniref:Uncharacterized protein n=1 Tax=Timema monikensis TaxID=170555 RepID=A0A7R9EJR6_9NEOP|nr:unnamed protein product [Timema monikensis]